MPARSEDSWYLQVFRRDKGTGVGLSARQGAGQPDPKPCSLPTNWRAHYTIRQPRASCRAHHADIISQDTKCMRTTCQTKASHITDTFSGDEWQAQPLISTMLCKIVRSCQQKQHAAVLHDLRGSNHTEVTEIKMLTRPRKKRTGGQTHQERTPGLAGIGLTFKVNSKIKTVCISKNRLYQHEEPWDPPVSDSRRSWHLFYGIAVSLFGM